MWYGFGNCKSHFVNILCHLQWEKLPCFNFFPVNLHWREDSKFFPACWILMGQFEFPARQPYANSNQYICVFLPCFQVPDSGSYTFYVSCDDWCELWKNDVHEDGIENRDKKSEESKQPIIALYAWTGYLQWDKWATHERDAESFFLNSDSFCLLSGMLLFPLNLHSLLLFFQGTQIKCRNQFFLTNVVFIKWRSLCVKLVAETTHLWACADLVESMNGLFQEQDCFGLNQVTLYSCYIYNRPRIYRY